MQTYTNQIQSRKGDKRRTSAKLPILLSSICAVFGFISDFTYAYASPAGTVIPNSATFNFEMRGERYNETSNIARLIVAEMLDVSVDTDAPRGTVQARRECVVGFRVANQGNGNEAFDLTAKAEGEGAAVLSIAVSADGAGAYDPAKDLPLPNPQVSLAAGAKALIFVIVGVPCPEASSVSLRAVARTGSGVPGTVFPNKGDGGGDAIVGKSGGDATGVVTGIELRRLSRSEQPALVKTQSVDGAPTGTAAIKSGMVVTYHLVATFPRPITDVEIEDPIPAGTEYVPGSLVLDGIALSDLADDDMGAASTASIRVRLGTVAPGNRTIEFKVRKL